MKDFTANNMKFIIQWGQLILVMIALTAILLIFIIKNKKKIGILKKVSALLSYLILIVTIAFSSMAFLSVSKMKSRFTEVIHGLDNIKGKKASNLTFHLVENDSVKNIEDYQGDVVLLNYWATWCPNCIKEFTDLNKLQDEFKDKGVTIIALSNEKREQLLKFQKKHQINLVSTYIKDFNWVDMGSARPVTFLINRDGAVVDYFTGSFTYDYFKAKICKYIN